MAQIEVFSTPMCPYCDRAKNLLKRKGAAYTEINLWQEENRRDEMIARAGGRFTVPQIFINGEHIGGCDELYALERAGQLDPKLAVA